MRLAWAPSRREWTSQLGKSKQPQQVRRGGYLAGQISIGIPAASDRGYLRAFGAFLAAGAPRPAAP